MFELLLLLSFSGDVRGLGADSFRARQRASDRLERWAWLAWPLLETDHADPEVRARARRIVEKAAPLRNFPVIAAALVTLPWDAYVPWKHRPWETDYGRTWAWRPACEFYRDPKSYQVTGVVMPAWTHRYLPTPRKHRGGDDWPAIHDADDLRQATRRVAAWLARRGVPLPVIHLGLWALRLRERSWQYLHYAGKECNWTGGDFLVWRN
jgi:hypothetical protein